jgi:hypothetical protein
MTDESARREIARLLHAPPPEMRTDVDAITTILDAYGVQCATAAETRARCRVLARMGEFTADERELLLAYGWL